MSFRGKTCGECSYGATCYVHGQPNWKAFHCRMTGLRLVPETTACPAFVPAKEEEPKRCPRCGTTDPPTMLCLASMPPRFRADCNCYYSSRNNGHPTEADALADFYKPIEKGDTP